MAEKGGISVQTEHIFPVIKKWLYSDKDIFLREIVSNASDAIMKLKHIAAIGEAKDIGDSFSIWVVIDKDKKTLSVSDNGIGMTEDEVKKYINQIALSGALDFIQKYDGESSDTKGPDGIIGHFGLGFYSSFMVSDRVNISTKSYNGAPAVFWTCTEEGEYEMVEGDRTTRGTEVTMCISESESEYLDKNKIAEILDKYKVGFIYDVGAYLETLDMIEDLKGTKFVPAHTPACDDMKELARVNRENVLQNIELIKDICKEGATAEQIQKEVFDRYGLVMDFNQYVLVGSTLRSYCSYMADQGMLGFEFVDNRLCWKTV